MFNEYCIGVIAICNPNSPPDRQIFYEKVKYERLMNVNITQLLADIRSVTEFSVKPTTNDDKKTYLGVYFQPYKSERNTQNERNKYRIISTFFDVTVFEVPGPSSNQTNQPQTVDSTSNSKNIPILSASDLYSMLREAHQSEINDVAHLNIPYFFLPSLRSYQLKGLQWMLNCEKITKYSDPEFVSIKCYSMPNQPFYFNYRTKQLMDYDPGSLRVPKGGILADEMGLGKTVEMLGLILCHPKLKRKALDTDNVQSVLCNKLGKKQILKCICSSMESSVSSSMIQCPECLFFQHERCVAKYSNKPVLDYLCAECWKLQQPIESSTTLIVSPSSIKMQWDEEIRKHIFGSNLKVLIYNGIKSGWISPRDLAAYDVVLTDYTAMQSEIHFTSDNSRQMVLRSTPRYITPASPLKMINWWRVVLDEAQMVETPTNNCSRMVKSLPAEHRWSVTGTPIEKSIDNLYGLMVFLDYEPFSDLKVWKKLTDQFNEGNAEPLINQCLKNVMWRTCKINVSNEIGIPPQTEIVHKVTLSDLEAFYYSTEHQQCSDAFYEKVQKLDSSLSMFKMNVQTLTKIMEPLRKLRQDCSNPTIFEYIPSQGQETTVKKILLTPEGLLKHMISKNEISCKEALKIIARNLNGMASIQIMKGKFDIAAEMYKSLLQWAKDYTGTVCVSLLLQVHAVHNLLEIIALSSQNEAETEYSKELQRLERKCFENINTKITTSKEHQVKFENNITAYYTNDDTEDSTFGWWKDYLMKINKTTKGRIMNQIRNTLRSYKNSDIESVTAEYASIDQVIYEVSAWMNKLQTEREKVLKWFMKLDFFSKNLKSGNVLSVKELQHIDEIIQSALYCHLDEKRNENTTSKKQTFCLLCRVRDVLVKYECFLFDKIYGQTDLGDRNANPCYQEVILKIILKSVQIEYKKSLENDEENEENEEKNNEETDEANDEETDEANDEEIDEANDEETGEEADEEMDEEADEEMDEEIDTEDLKRLTEHGEKLRKQISLIKDEFKEYKKYWDVVNWAAARYNDFEMCKSRGQVLDVDITLDRLTNEKQAAEENFFKFWGTLTYLKHLKNKTEPDECPICMEVPTTKYCVLQCGHSLCYDCYLKIAKKHKTNYDCCVCRRNQKMNDFYFVTCEPTKSSGDLGEDTDNVTGNYSRKIKKIVATALKLREEEKDVKIIIFSHWESILDVISKALFENGLQYRQKSVKFNKIIDDFKNKDLDITCLLLPLASGSKGLNLIEATHVFLVEPILNPAEEHQAIGRIHRIGQTKPTFVHRFISVNTIEENIFKTISNDNTGRWKTKEVTVENLKELFTLTP